jgi:alkaline phosphatase
MNRRAALTTVSALLLLAACAEEALPPPAPPPPPPPPDVVFLIGDGFGVGAWTLARELAKSRGERLVMDEAPALGFLDPRCADELVTDSAAAATAWSTGRAGIRLVVGHEGEPTLAEVAHAAGRAFGLVTTSRITHATPAPFYAHGDSRYEEAGYAPQLIEARLEVALGGGLREFLPTGAGGSRRDGLDLVTRARDAGIAVETEFRPPLPLDRPVIGLYASSHLPHELDRGDEPDLADLAVAAIRRLRAEGRPWLLVIEEARIDSAAHDHDGPGVAHNTIRLDRALRAILAEVSLDSTLVVLAADHATDSPAFVEWAHPESLDVATMSVERMERRIFDGSPWRGTPRALEAAALPVLDDGARQTGLSALDLDRLVSAESYYDRRTAIGDAISRRLGVTFLDYDDHLASSVVHGHTAELVPVRAWGRGAEGVEGVMDHAALGRWLREAAGLTGAGPAEAAHVGATAGSDPETGGDPATDLETAAEGAARAD